MGDCDCELEVYNNFGFVYNNFGKFSIVKKYYDDGFVFVKEL